MEHKREPVKNWNCCEDCGKEFNYFDKQNLNPWDWGRFCVRCKNTLRHRFLNWVMSRRKVKFNSWLHTYCLNKLHRK